MPYPNNCLKGIPNHDFLQSDGKPASYLFYFKKSLVVRQDGYIESSINWQDDDNTVAYTLSQCKADGSLQFQAGVAVLPREHIDRIANLPLVAGKLRYERSSHPDNPYHGNLLLEGTAEESTMKQIAATIALHVSSVIPPKQR